MSIKPRGDLSGNKSTENTYNGQTPQDAYHKDGWYPQIWWKSAQAKGSDAPQHRWSTKAKRLSSSRNRLHAQAKGSSTLWLKDEQA